jgi:cation transport ATPase
VLPSEKIPVDGEKSSLDEPIDRSMLTGEPVQCKSSQAVNRLSRNNSISRAIAIQANHIGKDLPWHESSNLVEDAQARKTPIQKLADPRS